MVKNGENIIQNVYTIRDLYELISCFKNILKNIENCDTHTDNEKTVVKQIGDVIFHKTIVTIIRHMSRCNSGCSKCGKSEGGKINGKVENNMCDVCNRCNGRNILLLINRIQILYEYGIGYAREYIAIDNNSELKQVNSYIFM